MGQLHPVTAVRAAHRAPMSGSCGSVKSRQGRLLRARCCAADECCLRVSFYRMCWTTVPNLFIISLRSTWQMRAGVLPGPVKLLL